jgi:hypothetical protein
MKNNEKIEQIDEQRLVDDDRMHAWLAGRVYLSRTTILITWNESKITNNDINRLNKW